MVCIGGVNVYPAQIEAVLKEVEGGPGRFQLVLDRKAGQDEATVLVEAAEQVFFGDVRRQREVVERLRSGLHQELGVEVGVKLVEKKTLTKDMDKVLDHRKV
jgi:phenylacetate-CoA ligase